ncbi:MAG TPA: hypothetical protein VFT04_09640 [Gemmatimonadales bacterium]|nr:hypothetical protein [Gemmatimonadales bacterium]
MARFDRGAFAAAAVMVVMLLLGVVSGVALDRWVLQPDREHGVGRSGAMPRERFDPARARTRFSSQLAEALALTPDQRSAIDSLLRRQQVRARAVMRETQPQLRQVTAETEAGIRAVLSEEQWNRWQELRRERIRRRPPPR